MISVSSVGLQPHLQVVVSLLELGDLGLLVPDNIAQVLEFMGDLLDSECQANYFCSYSCSRDRVFEI